MPNQALNVELRDHGKEVRLIVELDKLPTFFEWFEWWIEQLKELGVHVYTAMLERMLGNELGTRYGRSNVLLRKVCPSCGSREASRKGMRPRQVVIPRLGSLKVKRPYVECRDCGRSWAPYDEEMGLVARRRYHAPALMRPLLALCEMSYAKAARFYPESPSAMTLWRFVQSEQPPIDRAQAGDGTCVVDATLVPGDGPRGQMPVGVAHMIQRDVPRYGRATLKRRVVAVVAGEEEMLRDALQGQEIDTLLHDGRIVMNEVARRPARCRWHIPHMVQGYTLNQDRILGARRKALGAQLRRLIFTATDADTAIVRLNAWCDALFTPEHVTWRFLKRAMPELLRPFRYPEAYTVVSTSPVEREMREINRRMENGSHWSRSGAEALLKHHQIARHHPERYKLWLKTLKPNGAQNPKSSQT